MAVPPVWVWLSGCCWQWPWPPRGRWWLPGQVLGGCQGPVLGGCDTQEWRGLPTAMAPSIAPCPTHLPPKTRDKQLVALLEVH